MRCEYCASQTFQSNKIGTIICPIRPSNEVSNDPLTVNEGTETRQGPSRPSATQVQCADDFLEFFDPEYTPKPRSLTHIGDGKAL